MYLGDGHVANTRRSFQLRITLDGLYPGIIIECAGAMILSLASVHPRIRCDRAERRMNVDAGSKHWARPLSPSVALLDENVGPKWLSATRRAGFASRPPRVGSAS